MEDEGSNAGAEELGRSEARTLFSRGGDGGGEPDRRLGGFGDIRGIIFPSWELVDDSVLLCDGTDGCELCFAEMESSEDEALI